MSGLDKIIQQIEADAQTQADKLIEDAEQAAQIIRQEQQAACQQQLAQIADKSTRDVAVCQARAASALEQQRRMALLQTKQEVIAQMLQQALHTLQQAPQEEYFAAISKLVARFARPEDGQIAFSKADLERMDEPFIKLLDDIARKQGGSLTLAAEPRETEGGFILIYGGIEENCTFPALFDAARESLQDQVHALLFA